MQKIYEEQIIELKESIADKEKEIKDIYIRINRI